MPKRLSKRKAKKYILWFAGIHLETQIANGSEWIYEVFPDTTKEEGDLLEEIVQELSDELTRRGYGWENC